MARASWLSSLGKNRSAERRSAARPRALLALEILEDRTLLNGSLLSPVALTFAPPNSVQLSGTLSAATNPTPNPADFYTVTLPQDGQLILTATNAPTTQLTLFAAADPSVLGSQPVSLVQSDGVSGSPGTDLINQQLTAGTYIVEVQELGTGSCTYTLQASFAPAATPFQPVPLPAGTGSMATGDFNNDGKLDVATANFNITTQQASVSILLGNGDGTFQPAVTTTITGATDTLSLTAANLGNGQIDLLAYEPFTGTVYVLLGNGHGTFQTPVSYSTSAGGSGSALVADFNGFPDLALSSTYSNTVTILLGDGTGAFPGSVTLNVGTSPAAMVAGDFGNGHIDLAVADTGSADVSVLLGNGDGTFSPDVEYALAANPSDLVAADFGNGNLDLAVTLPSTNQVAVLRGDGNSTGTFDNNTQTAAAASYFAAGTDPTVIQAGNLGNGQVDLVVLNSSANGVSVLLGTGTGAFQAPVSYALSSTPTDLLLSDLGNGSLDVVTLDTLPTQATNYSSISVLVGNGDGTLQAAVSYNEGIEAIGLVAADLGNGAVDLVAANLNQVPPITFPIPGSLSVLLGNGNGTFQTNSAYPVGGGPTNAIAAVLTNDSDQDLVVADTAANAVSILIGNGDGTFQPANTYTVSAPAPGPLVVADFNGDGRPDLAVGSTTTGTISILLGNGDGTFTTGTTISLGSDPILGIVADPLSSNGVEDLIVSTSQGVYVLIGQGNGSFDAPNEIAGIVGTVQTAPVLADFNGDGKQDIAFGVFLSGFHTGTGWLVAVCQGNGDGTFQAPTYSLLEAYNPLIGGIQRFSGLQTAYLGNLSPDLVPALDLVASLAGVNMGPVNPEGDVAVLLGNGDGTFQTPVLYGGDAGPMVLGDFGNGMTDVATVYNYRPTNTSEVSVWLNSTLDPGTLSSSPTVYNVGLGVQAIAFADFSANGQQDLITADAQGGISVLAGNGDGTFQSALNEAAGAAPVALAEANFGNGEPDIAVVNQVSNDVSLFLGTTNATFAASGTVANPIESTPLPADPAFSGTGGFVLVDQQGAVLFRQAEPGQPGVFEAPVDVAPPSPLEQTVAVAVVAQPSGDLIAVLNASGLLDLYARNSDGSFSQVQQLITGANPTRIMTADLTGNGTDAIVVLNGNDTVSLFLSDPTGNYGLSQVLELNLGASDLAVAPGPNGAPDVLVTNRATGQVTILVNDGSGNFSVEGNNQAGTGLFGYDPAFQAVTSPLETGSLVVGDFTGLGTSDVITSNAGSDSLSLLAGTSNNGLLNPVNIVLGYSPGVIVTGDFTGNGLDDLAVLDPANDEIHVYLNNGSGGFVEKYSLNAQGQLGPLQVGSEATGLTVTDVNGDGIPDLIVGDRTGDMLVLLGKGDGTFQPLQPSDFGETVSLVTTASGAITADEATGDVTSYTLTAGGTAFNAGTPLPPPTGGVTITQRPTNAVSADLTGDGLQDLIVPNTGSNTISVYLATDDTGIHFEAPQIFSVGTDPVGVTVQDLNGDGIPDIAVANEGSNDVSILFGSGTGASWTLTDGPTLKVGQGPIAVSFQDENGDGIPDLVAVNSANSTVTVLPGIGSNGQGTGYFEDITPTVVSLPNTAGSSGQSTIVQADLNDGLALTNNGSLIQFDPATLGSSVGTVGTVVYNTLAGAAQPTFFNPFAGSTGTDLFLGTDDGSIQLLEPDAAGDFAAVGTAFTAPSLNDVSTLQVVSQESSNQFELYATNAGEDQPVVVQFGDTQGLPPVDLNGGLPVLIAPTPNAAVAVPIATADLTALSDGTLATIATLSTVTVDENAAGQQLTENERDLGLSGDIALAALASDADAGAVQDALVVSGAGVANAGAIPGDGDDSLANANAPPSNPDDPRVVLDRFITGIDDRLNLAIQDAEGSRGSGVTPEELRRALDQLFARVGASGLARDSADVLGQSGVIIQESLPAPSVQWLEATPPGQSDGVRLRDVLVTVGASVRGVDRVFVNVKEQLLAPAPTSVAPRAAPLEAPLPRPINPLDGDSRAPVPEHDRTTAVWLAAVFTVGLGGDVVRRRSRPSER